MSSFVHLHNHSDYSLLDGAVRIPWYVEECKKYGMKHVGLTDHGNIFGALHFEQACHAAGINPVVGCEVYVAPGSRFIKPTSGVKNYHMVHYCRNETGYRNLMALVSKGYTEGF
jgi:DNA polymerase-3 subunit alpha